MTYFSDIAFQSRLYGLRGFNFKKRTITEITVCLVHSLRKELAVEAIQRMANKDQSI